MKFFPCQKLLMLGVLFLSCVVVAQEKTSAVKNKSRWGNYLLVDAVWDAQPNLNRVLENNGLSKTPAFQAGATFGWLYQANRFEAGLDASLFGRSANKEEVEMQRRSIQLSLNFKYLTGKQVQWYPIAGVGFASGINRISPKSVATDINIALTTNRNTTTLHNQQGFAQIGAGIRFNGDSSAPVFEGFEVGYRLGFSATPWSTRQGGGNMTNSVTDELRQFYVRLVIVGFKKRR
jgi:hypothetical protein